MQEKVSVIIPSYNGDEHLIRAIQSVLEQTYRNIELIIVDDNGLGTPKQIWTKNAIQEFVSDARVKYIPHSVNQNGSAARNTGVKNATGKYICFLDDDDYFMPNKIEKQVELIQTLTPEYAVVYCGVNIVCLNKTEIKQYPKHKGYLSCDLLKRKIEISSSTLMIRKEAFESVGGFDESFKRHQDWEMLARLTKDYKADYVNELLVVKEMLYRNHPKKAETIEANRLYYLNMMRSVIDSFSKKDQQDIYGIHYCEIARVFFVQGNLKSWFRYVGLSKRPILAIYLSVKGVGRKIMNSLFERLSNGN